MPVSEAKRRANAKWNRENATMVGVQIKKGEAQQFKEVCKTCEVTPSMLIRVAMNDFVQRATGEKLFHNVEPWDEYVKAHLPSAGKERKDDLATEEVREAE